MDYSVTDNVFTMPFPDKGPKVEREERERAEKQETAK